MIALPDSHPNWPQKSDDTGQGGGAVVPLLDDDLSMGLKSDLSEFGFTFTLTKKRNIPKFQKSLISNLPLGTSLCRLQDKQMPPMRRTWGMIFYDFMELVLTANSTTRMCLELHISKKSVFKRRPSHGTGECCISMMARTLIGSYLMSHLQSVLVITDHGNEEIWGT